MQEEVTQKSIALVIRTSKLTADVLKKAIPSYPSIHLPVRLSCHNILY